MKKILIFFYFVFLLSCIRVYAAPVSYTRTREDLKLPDDINVQTIDVDTVLKIPAVDENAKVYDFANLLSDAEEAQLFIKLNEYTNNTGLDAVIVTVNDLQGLALKDYTYGFYDYNNFKDSGVSFVIYVGSDKKSIFMGNNGKSDSDVYKVYPDQRVTDILKYVYQNHIEQDDYMGACETYIQLIDGFYIKTFGSYKVGDKEPELKRYPWMEIAIISLVLSFIITILLYTKYQKPQNRFDQSMKKALNNTTMIVKCEYDKPVPEKNIGNS